MKKSTKIIGLLLAMVLLVCTSIFGTMAYLTSTDEVTNIFTVGKIALELDEAKTDEYGVADPTVARVKGNEYKLIPGHSYAKDPTIHVAADSENAYLFVKVENGIAAIEAASTTATPTIADQILANGWMKLTGVTGDIYYKEYTKSAAITHVNVFETFTINGNVLGGTKPEGTTASNDLYLEDYEEAEIIVKAYAVQKDGFASAAAAWDANFRPTPMPG